MNTVPSEPIGPQDPDALLERAFIKEYLCALGCDPRRLHELPEELVKEIMSQASLYASGRLTEIEARAGFVEELQGHGVPA